MLTCSLIPLIWATMAGPPPEPATVVPSPWMGGNLDRPSIAVPGDPEKGTSDPVAGRLLAALRTRESAYTGGYFINDGSYLHYAGGTRTVNAIMAELAKVEGATLVVKLSKEPGVTRWLVPGEDAQPLPCDCAIEHHGWGDFRSITLTVHLGGPGVDAAALEIPPIRGKAEPTTIPSK